MFINILLLHHHLSQEGIHASCIKQSAIIQNGKIFSMNELLMYGTACYNVDFSSLPRFKQSVEQVDFSVSAMFYNHLVRF